MAVSAPVDRALAVPESPNPLWDDEILSKWIRRAFWICGLVFGSMAAWAIRFSMNVDGVSYLDLGHAFENRGWNALVNGYWSPLYPVLLGTAVRLLHVSEYWESTVAHAVTFLLFLASMAAFEFFLRELCSYATKVREEGGLHPVPVWAMQALGYSIFLYAGLVWIPIENITPDQGVAAAMYMAAALLLRMCAGNFGWTLSAALGIVLGVGYLDKAVLFPLGLVSLAATLFAASGQPIARRMWRSLVTAFFFLLVASPLIVALSLAKGRVTFGDSGKLAYAGLVNGVQRSGYWRGEGNVGTPKHPVRMPMSDPRVYEFATPVEGTYPLWYDTSYWLDGAKPRLDVAGQSRVLADSARAYLGFAVEQGGFIVALLGIFAMEWRKYSVWRGMTAIWPCWISSLVGVGMFSLVLVESRYVASFLVILAMCKLAAARVVPSRATGQVLLGLTLGVAAITLLGVASVSSRNLYSATVKPRHLQWEVAQALAQRGIRPGDTVATIIDHRIGDYWAHLAQVRIVEDIPREELPKLIAMDAPSHVELARVLQRPGAKAIVTTPEPPPGTGFRWDRLGQTPYFISMLSPEGSN